jgi:hypothetical protein
MNAITEKEEDTITISIKRRFSLTIDISKYTVIINNILNNASKKMYL